MLSICLCGLATARPGARCDVNAFAGRGGERAETCRIGFLVHHFSILQPSSRTSASWRWNSTELEGSPEPRQLPAASLNPARSRKSPDSFSPLRWREREQRETKTLLALLSWNLGRTISKSQISLTLSTMRSSSYSVPMRDCARLFILRRESHNQNNNNGNL